MKKKKQLADLPSLPQDETTFSACTTISLSSEIPGCICFRNSRSWINMSQFEMHERLFEALCLV